MVTSNGPTTTGAGTDVATRTLDPERLTGLAVLTGSGSCPAVIDTFPDPAGVLPTVSTVGAVVRIVMRRTGSVVSATGGSGVALTTTERTVAWRSNTLKGVCPTEEASNPRPTAAVPRVVTVASREVTAEVTLLTLREDTADPPPSRPPQRRPVTAVRSNSTAADSSRRLSNSSRYGANRRPVFRPSLRS
jgi:hypothetical protein